ncbi:MAG: hypothetical protein LQ346_004866 [Caloplaca aetnensis]|nr:MAG: hypothetical protein LQ346_004866 [Caloplaca aetnensis]
MPSNTITFMATAFALLSATNGHMVMLTPPPYDAGVINSSPLDASGSDFPCKQRPSVYNPPPGGATKMAIGAPQTLSFKGSAVHGGGSCQISLTKDAKPTKDSKWMVIHSIEGGCPAKAEGNLPDNPNGNSATQFQYKIPQGIAPGEYTLAWTWFNQIGNREMYMNCAPISVSGGGKTRRDRDDDSSLNATETYASDQIFKRETSFPDMFKANIGNGCTTDNDGKPMDVKFPNPGASVEMAGDPSKLAPPKGSCGPSGGASSGGSDGSSSAAAAPAAPAAGGAAPVASSASAGGSNTAASAAPAGAPSPSMTIQAIPPPGVSASTGAAAMQSVQSAAQSVANAAQSIASGMVGPAAPAPTASGSGASAGSSGASSGESSGSGASNATPSSGASSSSSGGSTGAATGGSTSCSTSGQMVCSDDGKMFGTCGPDKTAKMMPVAAGTACKGGQIGFGKRSAKYAKAYRA